LEIVVEILFMGRMPLPSLNQQYQSIERNSFIIITCCTESSKI